MTIATTCVEHLTMARDKIMSIEHWTTGHEALADPKDPTSIVDVNSPHATCWCAMGAIRSTRSYGSESMVAEILASVILGLEDSRYFPRRVYPWEIVSDFNDSHGHRQVIEMFDKAILLAGKAHDE